MIYTTHAYSGDAHVVITLYNPSSERVEKEKKIAQYRAEQLATQPKQVEKEVPIENYHETLDAFDRWERGEKNIYE